MWISAWPINRHHHHRAAVAEISFTISQSLFFKKCHIYWGFQVVPSYLKLAKYLLVELLAACNVAPSSKFLPKNFGGGENHSTFCNRPIKMCNKVNHALINACVSGRYAFVSRSDRKEFCLMTVSCHRISQWEHLVYLVKLFLFSNKIDCRIGVTKTFPRVLYSLLSLFYNSSSNFFWN